MRKTGNSYEARNGADDWGMGLLMSLINPGRVSIRYSIKGNKSEAWLKKNILTAHYDGRVRDYIASDHGGTTSFTIDHKLDGCPGYLHHEEDWVQYIGDALRYRGITILSERIV